LVSSVSRWGAPSRRHLLRYGLFRAFLLVAILVIPSCFEPQLRDEAQRLILEHAQPRTYGAPSHPNKLPGFKTSYQAAPPSASGADPPYPLNHTFDADPITLGGQPNADFETAPTTVGTPPTDSTFAAGTFTAWTTTATPTIRTGSGGDGTWAQLDITASESVTSTAFTVDSSAQSLTVQLRGLIGLHRPGLHLRPFRSNLWHQHAVHLCQHRR
jgi:hypothetical protein